LADVNPPDITPGSEPPNRKRHRTLCSNSTGGYVLGVSPGLATDPGVMSGGLCPPIILVLHGLTDDCRLTGHWSCHLLTVLSAVWSIYIHCSRQLYTATWRAKTFLSATHMWPRWVIVYSLLTV